MWQPEQPLNHMVATRTLAGAGGVAAAAGLRTGFFAGFVAVVSSCEHTLQNCRVFAGFSV